jgi:hypothetical protein
LISSKDDWPTSLMNIDDPDGLNANVKGLRSPRAQIARFAPEAAPKNGLSGGIEPSGFSRRIFPSRLASVCALDAVPFSPTAT